MRVELWCYECHRQTVLTGDSWYEFAIEAVSEIAPHRGPTGNLCGVDWRVLSVEIGPDMSIPKAGEP